MFRLIKDNIVDLDKAPRLEIALSIVNIMGSLMNRRNRIDAPISVRLKNCLRLICNEGNERQTCKTLCRIFDAMRGLQKDSTACIFFLEVAIDVAEVRGGWPDDGSADIEEEIIINIINKLKNSYEKVDSEDSRAIFCDCLRLLQALIIPPQKEIHGLADECKDFPRISKRNFMVQMLENSVGSLCLNKFLLKDRQRQVLYYSIYNILTSENTIEKMLLRPEIITEIYRVLYVLFSSSSDFDVRIFVNFCGFLQTEAINIKDQERSRSISLHTLVLACFISFVDLLPDTAEKAAVQQELYKVLDTREQNSEGYAPFQISKRGLLSWEPKKDAAWSSIVTYIDFEKIAPQIRQILEVPPDQMIWDKNRAAMYLTTMEQNIHGVPDNTDDEGTLDPFINEPSILYTDSYAGDIDFPHEFAVQQTLPENLTTDPESGFTSSSGACATQIQINESRISLLINSLGADVGGSINPDIISSSSIPPSPRNIAMVPLNMSRKTTSGILSAMPNTRTFLNNIPCDTNPLFPNSTSLNDDFHFFNSLDVGGDMSHILGMKHFDLSKDIDLEPLEMVDEEDVLQTVIFNFDKTFDFGEVSQGNEDSGFVTKMTRKTKNVWKSVVNATKKFDGFDGADNLPEDMDFSEPLPPLNISNNTFSQNVPRFLKEEPSTGLNNKKSQKHSILKSVTLLVEPEEITREETLELADFAMCIEPRIKLKTDSPTLI